MPNTSIYKSPFNCFIKLQGRKTPLQCHRDYIVNHSKNIIYLIEVGDYVNGKRVIYVATIEDGDGNERLCVFVEETQDCIEARDIKSIVTKEKFEAMSYRLEV